MFQIDTMSREPVYEQIVRQVERFIFAGILKSGDKMPSVRNLSLELSVNPNTIQRAYSVLDSKELVISVPGKGCFVTEKAKDVIKKGSQKRLDDISAMAQNLLSDGISKSEIIEAVERGLSQK